MMKDEKSKMKNETVQKESQEKSRKSLDKSRKHIIVHEKHSRLWTLQKSPQKSRKVQKSPESHHFT